MQQRHVHLISCGVFRFALEHLAITKRYPNLTIELLPSHLHLFPGQLKDTLQEKFATTAQRQNQEQCKVVCLYGQCFQGIDEVCRTHRAVRVPGLHCYEILLGPDCFAQIIADCPGTFFLERDFIEHFREYCHIPLELDDPDMRQLFFGHYRRLFYLRQPDDPDFSERLIELARFLDLELSMEDVDYRFLDKLLFDIINKDQQS
jgi:hypothetical protein